MKTTEAIEVCEGWLAHLQKQKDRSVKMQRLAVLARTDTKEAQRQLRELDNNSVTVYDPSKLEEAVRYLIEAVTVFD